MSKETFNDYTKSDYYNGGAAEGYLADPRYFVLDTEEYQSLLNNGGKTSAPQNTINDGRVYSDEFWKQDGSYYAGVVDDYLANQRYFVLDTEEYQAIVKGGDEPEPVGPKSNEIWYTGEYYDMQAAIDYVSNDDYGLGEPYIGPKLLSNEFDGEKWILTFEEPVTIIGDIYKVDEDQRYSYPIFITEVGDEHSIECKVTSVTLPKSVISIGGYAFYGCESLTSMTIPNSVTSIGQYAFYGCESLTSVTIPNSVTSIGENAFASCSSLTSVTIGNSVTSIGNGAFSYCSSLTSIEIPDSVTSIGENAFANCTGLTSVTIGNSVTSIGNGAFVGCSSLTSVIIPNSVTSIRDSAFYGCSSLTSVTIGNSVTSIGEAAFYGCNSLTYVTCHAITPPAIESGCFDDTNNCWIYVPADSVGAYKAAEKWSKYADRIQAIP